MKSRLVFQTQRTIRDHHIITASGIASIEFAREIFKVLELFDEPAIEKWYQLFKHGVWQE